MNFLELTSYIGEREGYADDPEFLTDIWPRLMGKHHEIENLFLFQNRSGRVGWFGDCQVLSQNLIRIPSLAELSDDELDKIKYWSYYGGHFNVIYQVTTESSLVREFCKLYPSVKLIGDDMDQFPLEQESVVELQSFIATLPKEIVHLSFCHDGDPLQIFGDLEALRELLTIHYST